MVKQTLLIVGIIISLLSTSFLLSNVTTSTVKVEPALTLVEQASYPINMEDGTLIFIDGELHFQVDGDMYSVKLQKVNK